MQIEELAPPALRSAGGALRDAHASLCYSASSELHVAEHKKFKEWGFLGPPRYHRVFLKKAQVLSIIEEAINTLTEHYNPRHLEIHNI